MTGKHCDNCGDPIFRHDGQEFCPTCQHEARTQAQAQGQNGEARNGEAGTQPRNAETAAQSEADADRPSEADRSSEADRPADDEPRVEINDVRVADQHADRSNVRRPPSQTDGDRQPTGDSNRRARERAEGSARRGEDARERVQAHDHAHEQNRTQARDSARAHERDHHHTQGGSDLAPAREALVRKLTDLARSAEQTDDVARSRELLSATREAAEALAALDRANR